MSCCRCRKTLTFLYTCAHAWYLQSDEYANINFSYSIVELVYFIHIIIIIIKSHGLVSTHTITNIHVHACMLLHTHTHTHRGNERLTRRRSKEEPSNSISTRKISLMRTLIVRTGPSHQLNHQMD